MRKQGLQAVAGEKTVLDNWFGMCHGIGDLASEAKPRRRLWESILRSSFLLGDIGAEKHVLACPVCAADEDVCIGAFAHGHDAWEVPPAD